MRWRRRNTCGGSPIRTDDYTLELEVDEGGGLSWDEGELVFPDAPRCSCIDRFHDGLPPGTLVDLVGRYERPTRHERFIHVAHVMVFQRPLDRARYAFEDWERELGHEPGGDATRAARRHLELQLDAIVNDHSAAANELRAAVERRDQSGATPSFVQLLQQAPAPSLELLRRVYDAERDAGQDPTPTDADRRALVARIWQGQPYSEGQRPGLAPYWDGWVHPLVRAAHESLTQRANFPWHFGGPQVEPNAAALWPWIDRRYQRLASEEERAVIERVRGLDTKKRKKWLAKLRAKDERRYEREYARMASQWRGGPDGLDSPPDDVSVTWDEWAASLPASWCRHALAFEHDGQGSPSVAPRDAGAILAELYAKRRPKVRGAFVLALDAATILSSLEAPLTEELERVLFVSAGLLHGRALVQLESGLALLEAVEGAFGDWALHRGSAADLTARLPAEEQPLADMAIHDGSPTWPVVAPASHAIIEKMGDGTEAPRWVRHKRYGRGMVVGSTPGPRGPKLTIEFEGVGRKQVLYLFVEDE